MLYFLYKRRNCLCRKGEIEFSMALLCILGERGSAEEIKVPAR